MEIDLNIDPQEVIINPVNPPPNEFLELNDFIQQIGIPQPPTPEQAPEPQIPIQMIVDQEQTPFLNGFPIPQIPDLLGEEIPLDQLIDHLADEQQPNKLAQEDDFQVDQLVGPGEEGFPAHMDGIQLPQNPAKNELLQAADDLQQDQLIAHGIEDVVLQEFLEDQLPPRTRTRTRTTSTGTLGSDCT
jgi:hypothetical protein